MGISCKSHKHPDSSFPRGVTIQLMFETKERGNETLQTTFSLFGLAGSLPSKQPGARHLGPGTTEPSHAPRAPSEVRVTRGFQRAAAVTRAADPILCPRVCRLEAHTGLWGLGGPGLLVSFRSWALKPHPYNRAGLAGLSSWRIKARHPLPSRAPPYASALPRQSRQAGASEGKSRAIHRMTCTGGGCSWEDESWRWARTFPQARGGRGESPSEAPRVQCQGAGAK